jgi:hypothetical protein
MTLSSSGYHELVEEVLQRQALQLVHIWNPEDPRPMLERTALCGSPRHHNCPESADGGIVLISPEVHGDRLIPPSRCWCGSRICAVCLRLWREACERGGW